MAELENDNPNIYKKTEERRVTEIELNEDEVDPIDQREVFGTCIKPGFTLNFFIVLCSSQI